MNFHCVLRTGCTYPKFEFLYTIPEFDVIVIGLVVLGTGRVATPLTRSGVQAGAYALGSRDGP